ncbi:acyl carrier protein [Paenibacillus bouchesdurhonensis]|uniref:acyl carrier protein n=1 Tax=Paenibacillus bouchesdurhonensis TaxID=1870990 RepID=UPI000DA60356|nr:acyl carrier protein [Paenibacillus bouchesdurhonensis]
MEEVKTTIIDFIASNFIVNLEQLEENDSLVDRGIVDSTGIISIVSFIEDTYEFQIKDHEITIENFGSIHSIVQFVQTRIEKTSA